MDADDEDGAVIQAVRCGDKEAFRHIVDHHRGHVQQHIRRELGRACNPLVVEELTQDTFVKAWRDLGHYRHEGLFGAWVASIASHSTRDWRRRERRSRTTSVDAPAVVPTAGGWVSAPSEPVATGPGSDPLAELILRETVDQILTSMGRLPARDRTLLIGSTVVDANIIGMSVEGTAQVGVTWCQVRSNSVGVSVGEDAVVDLGQSQGRNDFSSTATKYVINFNQSETVQAVGNYWGACPPSSKKFYGGVNYASCLASPPQ